MASVPETTACPRCNGCGCYECLALGAVLGVLVRRYGAGEGARIHRLATTTHRGRVDSTEHTRWVAAAKEARDGQ